jgi:hypothetical protein
MRTARASVALAVAGAVLAVAASSAGAPQQPASPVGRHFLETRGLWVQFENRGSATGWNTGELLELIGDSAVRAEVVLQLRQMKAMGVNLIVYELRSADGVWPVDSSFPRCERATTLGPLWPRPTEAQLAGLEALFDLVHAQGMRISLILNTTHMDEQPPTGNAQWLSAILGAVKDEPALDLVMFGGDRRHVDAHPPFDGAPDSCGGESEAPLWLGADSVEGRYVQWAIGHALSLGLPPEKLAAEAIVGDYRHEARQVAGPAAQDRHLWPPLEVLRTIFDRLAIPGPQRTYALSSYPHTKCTFVDTSFLPCIEQGQEPWTRETLRLSRERVGPEARLTIAEFGTQSSDWPHERTVESLGRLLRDLGLEGGVYWQWVNPSNDPRYTHPGTDLKKRGPAFAYNPQQRELADLYGFHLRAIPNGSFEQGLRAWKVEGKGRAAASDVSAETRELPWRGRYALSLAPRATLSVLSGPIRVAPTTAYTTTGNLQADRAGSSVTFRYLTCSRRPSRVRAADRFPIRKTSGFETFPLRYTTPKDACFVRIEIAARAPTALHVDDLR